MYIFNLIHIVILFFFHNECFFDCTNIRFINMFKIVLNPKKMGENFFCIFPILISCFFGYEFISLLLPKTIRKSTLFCIGSMFGIIFSSWIFFIFNLKFELNRQHGIIHYLIMLLVAFVLFLINLLKNFLQRNTKKFKNQQKDQFFSTFFFSIFLPSLLLGYFIWTGLLQNGMTAKGPAYGDFPFHLNLITSFVYGCNKERRYLFDLLSPFYSSEKLAYPIIPNFYSAVLISCFDASIHQSVVYPSLIFIVSIFVILNEITYLFTESEEACCIAPWLFLFTGGLGFTQYFDEKMRKDPYIDYIHHWGGNRLEYWFQTVRHILLPQRASLFSIPIAWSVLFLLMRFNGEINVSAFFTIGIIVSLLPQVQPHSILALSQWGAMFALLTFPFCNKEKWKIWILNYGVLGITAMIIGIPQMTPYIGRTQQNFWKIQPLYAEQHPGENFITLWWYGLGGFIVLALLIAPLSLNKKQMMYYIPALFVFILANFIWYQPWSLDNTKVFNAGFIPFACVAVALFLVKIYTYFGFIGKVVSILLFCFCNASGFLSVYLLVTDNSNIWNIYEAPYVVADFIRYNTDPKGIWITDSWHTNPAICLAGRQNFAGYKGWLASHGLDYTERDRILQRFQQNPDNTTEIDQYNVTYVGIRPNINEINFHPDLSLGKWRLIYNSIVYYIYQRVL